MKQLVVALALFVSCAATAFAQDGTLDRVHNLIGAGRFTEATSILAQWETAHADAASNASSADRARALFLRGVLSTDAAQAEQAFLGVVLSYPSSAVAPQALLRLGQGLVTAGEARRAVAYLERLRSDYPGARERDAGLLWLARAHHAAGAAAAACVAARAAAETSDPNIRTLAELERDRVCVGQPAQSRPQTNAAQDARANGPPPGAQAPPSGRAATTAARDTVNPPARTATRDTVTPTARTAAAGDYAVQSAAFSARASADAIAARLRERSFDARVVLIEGSTLFRVRVGTFTSYGDANRVAARMRDAGFPAIIVNDVKKERTTP